MNANLLGTTHFGNARIDEFIQSSRRTAAHVQREEETPIKPRAKEMESSKIQVKIFVRGSHFRRKPATLFDGLESDVNIWLEANPNIVVANAHQLTQPNIGSSELAVAVWYAKADTDTTVH